MKLFPPIFEPETHRSDNEITFAFQKAISEKYSGVSFLIRELNHEFNKKSKKVESNFDENFLIIIKMTVIFTKNYINSPWKSHYSSSFSSPINIDHSWLTLDFFNPANPLETERTLVDTRYVPASYRSI